jgi:hypothetical protein
VKKSICNLEILDLQKVKEFKSKRTSINKNNYESLLQENPMTKINFQQKNISDLSKMIRKNLFKLRKSNKGRKPPVNDFYELRKRLQKMDTKVLARIAFKKNDGANAQAILKNDIILKDHSVMIV